MYRRPKFLTELLRIRETMSREVDYDVDLFVETVRSGLARMNSECKGSSMRVRRVLLMSEAPSVDSNEMTDKGYINQRATLQRRKALVDRLYAGGEGVIEI